MNEAESPAASVRREPTGQLANRVQSLRLPAARKAGGTSRWPWVLVVLLGGLASYTSLGGKIPFLPQPLQPTDATTSAANSSSVPTEGPTPSGSPPTTAGSETPPAAGQIVLESKGYIIPEQQILVSPQVSGRVLELNFEAGYDVRQGDTLAVLDSTEYRAELERSIANVAAAKERMAEAQVGNRPDEIRQAQAELGESKTQLEQAERTYKRNRELYLQKIITAQDMEDAQSNFEMLSKRVEKLSAMAQLMVDGPRPERKRIAEAELRAAEAELSRAQWRLDNTVIKAPISGTILKKNAELGNLVNPVAFNGSFSLCDVADLSKLEVELDIQERDISKVQPNQRCRIRAEAFPERFYEGYVSRLMPIANRAKGAVPVRVKITVPPEERGRYLKPEMGATVTFYAETIEPAGATAPRADSAESDIPSAIAPDPAPARPAGQEP